MKKETMFERKGRVITDLTAPEGSNKQEFKSINAAKRHSHTLQGTLGDGTVRVVQHKIWMAGKPQLDSSYRPGARKKGKQNKRETIADVAAKVLGQLKKVS